MAISFKGGIHIHDHKETSGLEVKPLMPCPKHIFPLIQHIGTPIEPIVKVGDTVKVGQKIADAESYMAVPIHSSISGTVKEICNYVHPSGTMVKSIIIENDNLYTSIDAKPVDNLDDLSDEQLQWLVREGGLVGLGGAGFPTHVKLAPKKPIKFFIINGAECEPYLTADHRRMVENSEDVIKGIHLAMKILHIKQAYIGIEKNKSECINALKLAARYDESINIIPLKTKYPQGAEKTLLKAIAGINLPSSKIPADVGALIMNVDTVYELGRILTTGMPITERIVTVAGDAVTEPDNFRVPIGVPISFLFESAKGFKCEPKKVIMGGPMMGNAQYTLDVPVIKTTSAVLAFANPDTVYDPEGTCIRCGRCVRFCPMQLMPFKISEAGLKNNVDMALKYHIMDCMQCGICSYVCPTKTNLLANIRNIRPDAINALRKEHE